MFQEEEVVDSHHSRLCMACQTDVLPGVSCILGKASFRLVWQDLLHPPHQMFQAPLHIILLLLIS